MVQKFLLILNNIKQKINNKINRIPENKITIRKDSLKVDLNTSFSDISVVSLNKYK
jgi:hypothetical protein